MTPLRGAKTSKYRFGTILAEFDPEFGWTLFVSGCRCETRSGKPRRRHVTLREAEECSSRVLRAHPLASVRSAV